MFLQTIKDALQTTLTEVFTSFFTGLPLVISAFIVLLIGWIIAKIVKVVLTKSLTAIKFDKLTEKVKLNELTNMIGLKTGPSALIAALAFWFIFSIFITRTCDMMGLSLVSEGIASIMAYIPNLLTAILIFVLGYFIADVIRNVVKSAAESFGSTTGKLLGNIVYYFLLIVISITALNQAGLNTAIINSNITLVIGGILLAFAIAYGFASRNILSSIVSSFYSGKKYKVGQTIKVDEIAGEIVEVDSVSITLQGEKKLVVIPLSKLVSQNVEIFE